MKSTSKSRLASLSGKRETARRPRAKTPLPSIVPSLPIPIEAEGKTFSLNERGVRTYCEEYGLDDDISFSFDECLNHIRLELAEALQNPRIPVSGRDDAYRCHSRNLVFTIHGSEIVTIRISLKYSSRSKPRSPK